MFAGLWLSQDGQANATNSNQADELLSEPTNSSERPLE